MLCFSDGCLSHFTGVATGLLGVYLRWLLYPHGEPLHMQQQMAQSQDHGLIKEREVYMNDNLADIITLKERQKQQRQKLKQNQRQSAHLRQRRKPAMLENSAQELLSREGSKSIPWSLVMLASIFIVLSVALTVKGFKGMVIHSKKNTHVI